MQHETRQDQVSQRGACRVLMLMAMLKLIAMWSQYLFTRGSRRRMNDAGTRCAVLSRCYCPDSGYGNPPPGEQERARNVVSRYE